VGWYDACFWRVCNQDQRVGCLRGQGWLAGMSRGLGIAQLVAGQRICASRMVNVRAQLGLGSPCLQCAALQAHKAREGQCCAVELAAEATKQVGRQMGWAWLLFIYLACRASPLVPFETSEGFFMTHYTLLNKWLILISRPKSPSTVYCCCMKAVCPSSLPRLTASQTSEGVWMVIDGA